jgi:hypothetical protein
MSFVKYGTIIGFTQVTELPTTIGGYGITDAVPNSRTITINGTTFDLAANRTFTVGSVTSVALSVPTGLSISGSPITSSGTLAITLTSGYSIPTTASQTNWDTAYTNRITSLTTTGTSGAATLIGNVLNIPQYAGGGGGGTVTSVASGNGMNFTTITSSGSVTLGTPSSTTLSSTNAVTTTSHTHAFAPGGTVSQYISGAGTLITFPTLTNGTVTSVAALTLGTTGTDVSSTVANSTTTPVITLNIPDASATARGLMTTGIQAFAGSKTFNATVTLSAFGARFTETGSLSSPPVGIGQLYAKTDKKIWYKNSDGTDYDLTANSGGTVTSVAALTLGTTGTDLSSTVANGTTTPVITLNVPTASATNRGALSSADWTTFNGKFNLPSLTLGSVLFSNGTTIAQDNANFFWDDTNNRLGIGTTSPSGTLDIRNASAGLSFRSQTNDVTTANNAGLLIYNTASSTAASRVTQLVLDPNGANGINADYFLIESYGDGVTNFFNTKADGIFKWSIDSGEKMRMTSSGNLLINTTTDDTVNKLQVNGSGKFNAELTVDSAFIGQVPTYGATFAQFSQKSRVGAGEYSFLSENTGNTYINAKSGYSIGFRINNSNVALIDTSGNLGLGVTLSAWSGYGLPIIELPSGGTIVGAGSSATIGANWYYNSPNFIYKVSSGASYFIQSAGSHIWYNAPSGTAGNAITFTQAMTLTSAGNLLIGSTTDDTANKLQVNGSGKFSSSVTATQNTAGIVNQFILENLSAAAGADGSSIYFKGYQGSLAKITGYGFPQDQLGGYLQLQSYSNNTTANTGLIIHQSGNVLINTTTDDTVNKLQVNGSGKFLGTTIQIRDASTNNGARVLFLGSSTGKNFQVGNQYTLSDTFEITPSTTNGGTTFTTPALSIAGSGAATFSGGSLRQNDSTNSFGYTITTTSATTTLATLFGGSSFAIQTAGSGTNQLLIASSGAATFSQSLGINGQADSVKGNVYSPTLTDITNINISSTSGATFTYIRVGYIVTVNGFVNVAVNTIATLFQLNISLPIASAFTVASDATGVATSLGFGYGYLIGDATADTVQLNATSSTLSSKPFHVQFSYFLK